MKESVSETVAVRLGPHDQVADGDRVPGPDLQGAQRPDGPALGLPTLLGPSLGIAAGRGLLVDHMPQVAHLAAKRPGPLLRPVAPIGNSNHLRTPELARPERPAGR
jgi:hypothetical protein